MCYAISKSPGIPSRTKLQITYIDDFITLLTFSTPCLTFLLPYSHSLELLLKWIILLTFNYVFDNYSSETHGTSGLLIQNLTCNLLVCWHIDTLRTESKSQTRHWKQLLLLTSLSLMLSRNPVKTAFHKSVTPSPLSFISNEQPNLVRGISNMCPASVIPFPFFHY